MTGMVATTINEKKGTKDILKKGDVTCGKNEVGDETPTSSKIKQKTDVSLQDVMEQLNKIDEKYDKILGMYNRQIQINQELRDEITNLKIQLEKIETTKGTVAPIDITSTIKEIGEREARKTNLMVFGCIEAEDGETENNDINRISEMIKSICQEMNVQNIRVKRVGKQNPEIPRPLRVSLSSEQQVRTLFFKAKELTRIPMYNNLALSFDKTRQQIEEYKQLRADEIKWRGRYKN